jgi:GntR family transcriptional regulator
MEVNMNNQFNDNIPIYIQIMNLIKRDIVTQKRKPGDKLPSIRELSEELKVNPNTLSRAYSELEREGITFTLRGTGTFIKDDEKMIEDIKKQSASKVIFEFINGMKSLGFLGDEIIQIIAHEINKEEE